jgi:hypothetical protein
MSSKITVVDVEPIAGRTGAIARLLDVSPTTVRRVASMDPDFPAPFRLSSGGDPLWLLDDVRAYAQRKAGRERAA